MRILISILILFQPLLSFSQELKVSVDKNPALTNEVIQLQFFINAQASNFIPPSLTNFYVLNGPSQGFSQSYSNINGQTTREIETTISYNIQAKKAGKFKIGPASVSVDNKIIKSKNIEIVVKSAEKKNKNTNNEKQVFIKLHINKSEIFIGEQISAISKIYIKNGVNIQNTEISPITYDGFWEDEVKINTNKQQREIIDGVAFTVIKFRHSVLTAQKDGDIIIPSSEMNISIPTRGKLISNHPFFGPQYQTILKSESISSRPRKIKVKELPHPKPKHFFGIVSENFTINTNIDRTNLKTSEAISLKVIFRGKGNINMLEPFDLELPSSFEVFDPTITDETYVGNNNTGGIKTFEYTIIPRMKGSFTIPEIKFVYFNPKTKKYIELKTKEYLISVEEGKQYMTNDTTQNSLKNLDLLKNSSLSSIKKRESWFSSIIKKFSKITFSKKESGFSSISKRESISKWYIFSYWIIFTVIIIGYLVYFILSKRSVNPIETRRRKSTKIAIKRLKKAHFCLKNDNFDQFFEEIERALWGYFADKFEVNSSELSKETIDLYFDKRNIKPKTKNNFVLLLNICEFDRYSPSKNRSLQMERTLEDAKEIIIEVESDMKKK